MGGGWYEFGLRELALKKTTGTCSKFSNCLVLFFMFSFVFCLTNERHKTRPGALFYTVLVLVSLKLKSSPMLHE